MSNDCGAEGIMTRHFSIRILLALIAVFIGGLSLSHAQNIEDLKAGVVKITATTDGQKRIGTGFIVKIENETAYIVTASHVVEGASLTVNFHPNPDVDYSGKVKGMDGGNPKGLAVILVQGSLPKGLRPLTLAFNVTVTGGEPITLIGFPRAIGVSWAVATGSIAGQKGLDVIVTGSAVQEGNSGGPILVNNVVVGVLTSVQGDFGYGMLSSTTHTALRGWGVRVVRSSNQEETIVSSGGRKIDRMPDITQQITEISSPDLPSPEKDQSLKNEITGRDGAPMVLVPAGEFTMGSPDGVGSKSEHPQHTVELDAYYIDQYEVTVEQYHQFKSQTGRKGQGWWGHVVWERDRQKPAIGVNWQDAKDYCQWAHKRLPTEAEWEKAARGTDKRIYPWGDTKPDSSTANFGRPTYQTTDLYAKDLKNKGSYARDKSPYKVFDMAGNVKEWVADESSNGYSKIVRGGSYASGPEGLKSTYSIAHPSPTVLTNLGFRCAKDAP